jgi:hypothetical protein
MRAIPSGVISLPPDDGRFELTTIVPGVYPGRTRHIHVKVQAPDGPILTTQLYFPDEPGNASDGIFDERLLMDMSEEDDRRVGVLYIRCRVVLGFSLHPNRRQGATNVA